MDSKREELLAGYDIEGILAVIDNDMLAEPNDLETEFAVTVSKIQEINSVFYAKIAEKTYKTKRGLNCHQSAEHGDYTNTCKERLPLDIFEQFVTTSKVKLANDQCFESFMGEFSAFVINTECINTESIVFYLAGYVFSTFSRRLRLTKKITRIQK